MFIEPSRRRDPPHLRTGWIEVICGSMFSGKTEELIRRLNRARIAKLKVQIFKPALDNRYHAENIVSHSAVAIHSTPVQTASQILLLAGDCEVVGVDEAQFFDKEIVSICNELANQGKRVIVAGLDMDFAGNPFGCMPQLMGIAEYVTKVHAICVVCGDIAQYSYRLVPSQERVLLGETDSYEARCRRCFNLGDDAVRKEWAYEDVKNDE
ncbi:MULTISPECIES: thymidine kinase [unclassified Spirosoma]|uniref:thymidine kinase n=1 Tax=unclassified Spirosoma TaxID=2621999 RepID=UPI000968D944|nr:MULTISPECIES: thymidine kinase [unclassified Spirosoma]MBN8823151.1 thymidine kinase [Spirosoma sp.]OJW73236.1 MAG: thymidine kinase [Spirosoma sp. 48-14]